MRSEEAAPTDGPLGESDPAVAQRKSRAGRNLPAAIGVGVGLGSLVVASLFLVKDAFVLVVVIALGVGFWELARALAEFLLKRGCDPNHSLWAAVFVNDLAAIRLLIKYKADIDPRQEDATPFLGAVKWSRFDAAKLLLDLGADVNAQDSTGMTALHYMLKKDSDKEHFRMIVAHGARGDIPGHPI